MPSSKTLLPNTPCPCGRSTELKDCCGQYLMGHQVAPTAEALMRSRYSAYATQNVEYLLATLHPTQRRPGEKRRLQQAVRQTSWVHLVILDCSKGQPQDNDGEVEFVAVYQQPGSALRLAAAKTLGQMHERSRFIQQDGQWFYYDGDQLPGYQPKRNQPCWCGSGNKFKQCHGKLA